MGELRNVVVFTMGRLRYAIELRWVREIASLGFITTVPTSPPVLCGLTNLHGFVTPVLDLLTLLTGVTGPPARQGDSSIVIEADGVVCALRIDRVDHVATLREVQHQEMAEPTLHLADATGQPIVMLEPAQLMQRALTQMAGP